ncbi:hypothetical protein BJ742DRAFT_804186 [Cladochytrium replicatum]|nr:hypothetical protein BJ742DRAFT_804186 [Cladochytrium replicatum]
MKRRPFSSPACWKDALCSPAQNLRPKPTLTKATNNDTAKQESVTKGFADPRFSIWPLDQMSTSSYDSSVEDCPAVRHAPSRPRTAPASFIGSVSTDVSQMRTRKAGHFTSTGVKYYPYIGIYKDRKVRIVKGSTVDVAGSSMIKETGIPLADLNETALCEASESSPDIKESLCSDIVNDSSGSSPGASSPKSEQERLSDTTEKEFLALAQQAVLSDSADSLLEETRSEADQDVDVDTETSAPDTPDSKEAGETQSITETHIETPPHLVNPLSRSLSISANARQLSTNLGRSSSQIHQTRLRRFGSQVSKADESVKGCREAWPESPRRSQRPDSVARKPPFHFRNAILPRPQSMVEIRKGSRITSNQISMVNLPNMRYSNASVPEEQEASCSIGGSTTRTLSRRVGWSSKITVVESKPKSVKAADLADSDRSSVSPRLRG